MGRINSVKKKKRSLNSWAKDSFATGKRRVLGASLFLGKKATDASSTFFRYHRYQIFVQMSLQHTGTKRARTEHQDGAGGADNLPGREQLLLTCPELQTRVGRKFVDETELLSLLLAHGLIRRVRTIQIEVRPLGGDSFKVTLDASKPTVGEAKAEIARSQGTAESRQEMYKVAERADGLAVREDDAEPEPLEDESRQLEDGDIVAMAVKVSSVLSAKIHLLRSL
jgi:hypothetical protein